MSNLVRIENVQQLLKMVEPSFNQMAAIHNAVDYRREASFALQALQDNEFLATTAMKNQDSFKRAIINVAAIGLSLNPIKKMAYLIPRKGRVCLDISYIGLITLAVDEKSIKWAQSEIVRENDHYTFNGVGEKPDHEFKPFSEDRGKIIGAYCVAKTNQDEFITIQMSIKQIYEIRNRSESFKSGKSGPWSTDEEEMIKKTVIRRASKSWPRTSTMDRLERAVEATEDALGLAAPVVIDNEKRTEQFLFIDELLLKLNIDKEFFIKDKIPKFTRREVKDFDELTDQEISIILIQLTQLVEEKSEVKNG